MKMFRRPRLISVIEVSNCFLKCRALHLSKFGVCMQYTTTVSYSINKNGTFEVKI